MWSKERDNKDSTPTPTLVPFWLSIPFLTISDLLRSVILAGTTKTTDGHYFLNQAVLKEFEIGYAYLSISPYRINPESRDTHSAFVGIR